MPANKLRPTKHNCQQTNFDPQNINCQQTNFDPQNIIARKIVKDPDYKSVETSYHRKQFLLQVMDSHKRYDEYLAKKKEEEDRIKAESKRNEAKKMER